MNEQMQFEQESAEMTRRWARYFFRKHQNINDSIHWLGTNVEERSTLVRDFTMIIEKINVLFGNPDLIPDEYSDIKKLHELARGENLPSLNTIEKSVRKRPETALAVTKTFDYSKNNFPSWANILYSHKPKSAVGIFIEGYGRLLGELFYPYDETMIQRTNRAFVKGFEEILVTDYPQSALFSNVIDWVLQEKTDFPQKIWGRIDQLEVHTPR